MWTSSCRQVIALATRAANRLERGSRRLYVSGVSSGEEIRLALTLHYDGGAFFGWQSQREERTVQGELEAAVERLTGARRRVLGSGRTDRGVHATGQVAALSVPARWTAAAFRKALNALLPEDVWVQAARAVPSAFHPRYDAIARTYVYRVGVDEEARSPFLRRWCWCVRSAPDPALLASAAAAVVGSHSFAAFAKAGQPERGDRCAVRSASWEPWEALGLAFTITADRYLHHMVRYLVGTMLEIGRGARPLDDLPALLERGPGKDRETSPPAPARGLYLTGVEYPQQALGDT
jgi:tRNA pseudouridine38-40 synthase